MNSPVVAGWLFVLTTLLFAGLAVSDHADATALRDRGIRVAATVTAVHDRGRDSSVTVEFTTADGRELTADVENYRWSPKPRVGDRPTIIYDPSDPSGTLADARMGPDFLGAWVAGGIAVLFAIGAWLTFTRRIDLNRW